MQPSHSKSRNSTSTACSFGALDSTRLSGRITGVASEGALCPVPEEAVCPEPWGAASRGPLAATTPTISPASTTAASTTQTMVLALRDVVPGVDGSEGVGLRVGVLTKGSVSVGGDGTLPSGWE